MQDTMTPINGFRNIAESFDRDPTIARIKAALKQRTGLAWSVTGGRGTAWGWIRIIATPARCTFRHRLPAGMADWPSNYVEYDSGRPGGHMGPVDRKILADALGLDRGDMQGVSIPASSAYYAEYIDRAEGRKPTKEGTPYWD